MSILLLIILIGNGEVWNQSEESSLAVDKPANAWRNDRWFLDCICTHLIVFEGDSVVKMYIGNWSDYETMMVEKFGKDLTSHRVKYRTMKR